MKPVATQPVEQHAPPVHLPSNIPPEKPASPTPAKNVITPSDVKPPTPAPVDETTTEDVSAVEKSPSKHSWGKPSAIIWIGNPPEDIRVMFPPGHREKIKDIRTAFGRGTNFPYALVYFHTMEEASAAIETLNHSKLKFGEEFDGPPRGNYPTRGGGSFSQGSYDARKSGGSDTENRGGFGRGGRGGRGGASSRGSGSVGSYSGRGGGSPAPGRGGSRGRGGPPSNLSKDMSSDNDKSEAALWQNDDKPAVPASDISETKPPATNPVPAPAEPPVTSAPSLGAQSSTAGESQSS